MNIASQDQWQRLNLNTQPPAQRGSRLAFDKQHQQVVCVVAGETWLWKNGAWNQITSQSKPPARSTTHLVYDSTRQGVWLFGGIGVDGTPLNDMWLWNGTGWTAQRPTALPAAVGGAGIACHAAAQQIILFGGISGFDGFSGSNRVGTFSNETWLWNGKTWTEQHVDNPPPARAGAQLVYDEAHQQTLLFGGNNLTGYLNDTWIWNGSSWNQLAPTTLPPAQARYNVTFHEQLQQVMLTGEIMSGDTQAPSYQTWLWNGTNWSQASTNSNPSGSIESMAYNGSTGNVIACVVSGGKAPPAAKSATTELPDVVAATAGSETWIWG